MRLIIQALYNKAKYAKHRFSLSHQSINNNYVINTTWLMGTWSSINMYLNYWKYVIKLVTGS